MVDHDPWPYSLPALNIHKEVLPCRRTCSTNGHSFGLDLSKKTFHGCILDGPDLGSRHFFTGEMGQQGKAKLAGRLGKPSVSR